jgi:sulfite reductase beta subunit-like hemoprotein
VLAIIDTLIAHYRRRRSGEETFIQTVNRVGATSFREAIDAARR